MSSVQARRTLVKSPPELWAELSDAEALGRRLEPLGEIRITRIEPESTVAWEGRRARGTVEIEPSGWGTRVTLTAEPSAIEADPIAEPPEAPAEPEPEPEPEPLPEPEAEPEPEPQPEPQPDPEPVSIAHGLGESEPLPQTMSALGQDFPLGPPVAPVPGRARRLRRMLGTFGRRPNVTPVPVPWPAAEIPPSPARDPQPTIPAPAPAPEPAPAPHPTPAPSPHPTPAPSPHPVPDPEPQPDPDPAPEPERPPLDPAATSPDEGLAAMGDEELDELLTGVLNDLGAAHHRPFSRG